MELPGTEHCTMQEAAARLGVGVQAIRRALWERRLCGFRLGRTWFVWADDLAGYRERTSRQRAEVARRAINRVNATPRARKGCCPRCEILWSGGDLCPDCQAELAHEPYAVGGAFWSCE